MPPRGPAGAWSGTPAVPPWSDLQLCSRTLSSIGRSGAWARAPVAAASTIATAPIARLIGPGTIPRYERKERMRNVALVCYHYCGGRAPRSEPPHAAALRHRLPVSARALRRRGVRARRGDEHRAAVRVPRAAHHACPLAAAAQPDPGQVPRRRVRARAGADPARRARHARELPARVPPQDRAEARRRRGTVVHGPARHGQEDARDGALDRGDAPPARRRDLHGAAAHVAHLRGAEEPGPGRPQRPPAPHGRRRPPPPRGPRCDRPERLGPPDLLQRRERPLPGAALGRLHRRREAAPGPGRLRGPAHLLTTDGDVRGPDPDVRGRLPHPRHERGLGARSARPLKTFPCYGTEKRSIDAPDRPALPIRRSRQLLPP